MSTIISRKIRITYFTFLLTIFFGLSINFTSGFAKENHRHHQKLMDDTGAYVRKSANYAIPDVILIRSDGSKTSLRALIKGDEAIILNFIFTSCTAICPIMSGTFAQVNSRISNDENVRMVSISIDPEYDTPAMLVKYASKFDANSNWTFLTGELGDIIATQKAFDAYRGKKMNHVPVTFIHTKNKSNWLRLDGFASSNDIFREYMNFKK